MSNIRIRQRSSNKTSLVAVMMTVGSVLHAAAQSAPVLYFSDVTSGPRSGNSDSSGGLPPGQNGAIVTVWGTGIGSSRGGSKIYCNGAEAPSYYYWGNATKPANLYASHRMQMISFQVSGTAQNGKGVIYAVVNGQQSNTLPFTVRSGSMYFVKTSGSDATGDGSWTLPWRTIGKAVASLGNGDIAYVGNGVSQTTAGEYDAAVNLGSSGTADSPKALIVYPGATAKVGNPKIYRAFHSWGTGTGGYVQHWVLSKFSITTKVVGVFANTGFRVVGNRLTGAKTNEGMEGTIYAIGSDVYLLGNELRNIGTAQSNDSKLQHVIYVTGVRQDEAPRAPTERTREIAWNYLHDNYVNRGINIYSEQNGSAYIQQHRIHDNVIVNQRGDGILVGYYVTAENWIYNNLIVRAGLGPELDNPSTHAGIQIDTGHESVPRAKTIIHCYNNTLYGCGFSGAVYPGENGALFITSSATSRSTLRFANNIVVSTGEPYLAGDSGTPTSGDYRGCWFGDGAAPRWDEGAINADPQFVSSASRDFQLRSTSPCRDAGKDVSKTVARDLLGVRRPQGSAFDLGAYELRPAQRSGSAARRESPQNRENKHD